MARPTSTPRSGGAALPVIALAGFVLMCAAINGAIGFSMLGERGVKRRELWREQVWWHLGH